MARGFTLIEVMVAATIGLVALGGSVAAFASNSVVHQAQIEKTTALTVAENQMEDLLVRLRTDADLQAGDWGPVYFDRDGDVSDLTNSYFSVTWRVQENTPISSVRRVTVEASWTTRGHPHSVQLVTERL